jgi:plasmid maintenance system antidote protein VapI
MMNYFINSLEKFKIQQREEVSTKRDLILQIFAENPEANQTKVAEMVGVSREYVNRVCRSQVTGHTAIEPNTAVGFN